MFSHTRCFFFVSLLVYDHARAQSPGSTPIMGYNSYNQVACTPTDSQITAAINAMASRGFLAAGYSFFQVDCGWASRDDTRASNGALKIDTDRFPNGLKPLSDLARSKGFKWSMYSDAGVRMCDTQAPSPVAGSLGYESQDAALFASLNTEYVKCKFQNLLTLIPLRLINSQTITAMPMDRLHPRTLQKLRGQIFQPGSQKCGTLCKLLVSLECSSASGELLIQARLDSRVPTIGPRGFRRPFDFRMTSPQGGLLCTASTMKPFMLPSPVKSGQVTTLMPICSKSVILE